MEEFRLRRTTGALSGGTRVSVKRRVKNIGVLVETRSPIPVIRQKSFFDGEGIQRHVREEIGRQPFELWTSPDNVVPVRKTK